LAVRDDSPDKKLYHFVFTQVQHEMDRSMKLFVTIVIVVVAFVLCAESELAADDRVRLSELDAYWAEVSRAVGEGDFEGYKATCHEDGVLVSGSRKNSQPLSEALARWNKDFVATKAGKVKANVEFRFSQRFGDGTTAHETGIFHYRAVDSEGKSKDRYIHFEGLLVKKNGKWKILMEYQKSKATLEEWKALK